MNNHLALFQWNCQIVWLWTHLDLSEFLHVKLWNEVYGYVVTYWTKNCHLNINWNESERYRREIVVGERQWALKLLYTSKFESSCGRAINFRQCDCKMKQKNHIHNWQKFSIPRNKKKVFMFIFRSDSFHFIPFRIVGNGVELAHTQFFFVSCLKIQQNNESLRFVRSVSLFFCFPSSLVHFIIRP